MSGKRKQLRGKICKGNYVYKVKARMEHIKGMENTTNVKENISVLYFKQDSNRNQRELAVVTESSSPSSNKILQRNTPAGGEKPANLNTRHTPNTIAKLPKKNSCVRPKSPKSFAWVNDTVKVSDEDIKKARRKWDRMPVNQRANVLKTWKISISNAPLPLKCMPVEVEKLLADSLGWS